MEASSFCCPCASCQQAKRTAVARGEDVATKPMWLRPEGPLPRVLAVQLSDKRAACRADYLAAAGAIPAVCSLSICDRGSATSGCRVESVLARASMLDATSLLFGSNGRRLGGAQAFLGLDRLYPRVQ